LKTNITHHFSELDKRLGTTPGLEQGSNSELGRGLSEKPIPEHRSSRFLLEGLFTNQVSSVTGLVAAGLSGLLISSLSSRFSRFSRSSNQAQRTEERVFRGAEAEQHSWPWIARIKV